MPSDTRGCIGCKCHRVPWNQGSDYCDVCHAQEVRGGNHRNAARIVRLERAAIRAAKGGAS